LKEAELNKVWKWTSRRSRRMKIRGAIQIPKPKQTAILL